MTNKEKKEYSSILSACILHKACCSLRSDLNVAEELELKYHLKVLMLMYILRQHSFSWKNFTKNDWSY